MQLLRPPVHEDPAPCPYLPGRMRRYRSFLARELDGVELGRLLASGWRKFGFYFFRPECPDCRSCRPLRIPVAGFVPSRSQRRRLRLGAGLEVRFGPLRFSERVFEIYRRHAETRFTEAVDREEFLLQFYLPSGPALQTEVRLDGRLIGVGFLDRASNALSSIYFCFDPAAGKMGLGTLSILEETALARRLGLDHYYLGYRVEGCGKTAYKGDFRPAQVLDWERGSWVPFARPGE